MLKIRQNPKDELNEKINLLLDYVYEENFDKVTHGLAPKKSSKGRQIVEGIIARFLVPKESAASKLFLNDDEK